MKTYKDAKYWESQHKIQPETFSYQRGCEIGRRNAAVRATHRKNKVVPYYIKNGILWICDTFKRLNYNTCKYTTKLCYSPWRGLPQ